MEEITSLADLVEPERFKTVLRHYHERANRKPNAFVIGLAKTLIQVAHYHVGATPREIDSAQAHRLQAPSHPSRPTAKNKAAPAQFESDRLRRSSCFCRSSLMAEVTKTLETRPTRLRRSPGGDRHRLSAGYPAQATESELPQLAAAFQSSLTARRAVCSSTSLRPRRSRGKQDFIAEIPDHVARRLRWYRRHILPRLNADVNGDLFVTEKGVRKDQKTITIQITRTIERPPRHPHDRRTSSVTSPERPISRRTPRTSRRQEPSRPCLEQDDADLCRLLEPARQPRL